ncbi:DUF3616 domain-containing protein [Rhizobium leguminosarum]|uniref:DUF3616 domain-containing protein n=1 Tax=Rhizobium leguminosarum TaxID=384 RepID=UPI003F952FDA
MYIRRLSLSMMMVCSLGMPAGAESRKYEQICEASAAALLDQSRVAIASDDFDTILTYQRGKPAPVGKFDLGDDVTDIEAGARIGDRIYWVTSHSLNSDGEDKKKRKMLFATKVGSDGTLSSDGKKYRGLRQDLAAALGRSEERLVADLNIEGMTATPDGHLLIGLRGPETMPGDKAILVEIANPGELVASDGARADVTRVVTLDLSDGIGTSGRGIRDIALVGDQYIIVAGAEPDGGVPTPRLFWWDGQSENVAAGPPADFSGMTPEGIVVWNEHEAEVLSDNGGATINGVECNDKSPPSNAYFPALDINF